MAGQFQLAHTRGSAFLSVRSVVAKASCNVNVRYNKQTYVFEFDTLTDTPLKQGVNERDLRLLNRPSVWPGLIYLKQY